MGEMTDSKTSLKAANGKTSPKANGKTSPKADKDATAASPKKESKTTPNGKGAKDEEMEVEVANGKDTKSPKTGSGKKLDPTGVSNGKKESEEDSKDGDSQDGEEDAEDKENGEEEEEAADGEEGKDDSIQGDGAEKEDVAATE